MEEKDQLAAQIDMAQISPVASANMGGGYNSDSSQSSFSHDTLTMTHTQTMTVMTSDPSAKTESIGGNPKNWGWEQVKQWLNLRGLSVMVPCFEEGATEKAGTDGDELLDIDMNKLFDNSGAYKAGEKLNIPSIDEAENNPLIEKFFRELTKLQLRANESGDSFSEKEATIDDFIEMKRRIYLFIEKWDRILWIENYIDVNNKLPSKSVISDELGVSTAIGQVYLDYYNSMDRLKAKDINELLLDFNVYNDCVIWWFIIINILTSQQTKSIWLLFNRIAELTPGNVAIELLDKYKFDLTRFDSEYLDSLAQNIVIGSQYPVCASLRMAKWFIDIANYDVARGEMFNEISDAFIDAAFDYLNLCESDHIATILLEVKSDISSMSALDMALEYKLTKFIANNRIERVTTSVMNDFEFLRPKNDFEAFEIDPLSVKLIWRKIWYPQFYFTPLGTYVVQIILYFAYLGLFTYLSIKQFRVYDSMSAEEIVFWVFNIGYIMFEAQQLISDGVKQYYSEAQNYFDTVISVVFLTDIIIRLYALYTGPPCDYEVMIDDEPSDYKCWNADSLNVAFTILWAVATITLWLRIINFCILSHNLGPMVQMIFRMMSDIITFFEILAVLFCAFSFALYFLLYDVNEEFKDIGTASITLFRAALGDFDFGNFDGDHGDYVSPQLIFFGYCVMLFYIVLAGLIFLNLLIAMMAKTFDTIEDDTTSAIIFAKFQLSIDLDTTASYMPPPLNVLAMGLLLIFYTIEITVNIIKKLCCFCCTKSTEFLKWDFAVTLMPKFMRERKLELDEQILFKNCGRKWIIQTNQGPTECKFVKYKGEIMHHYIKFYNNRGKGIRVSVDNAVEKQHQWLLDVFELHAKGLIDFKQFNDVFVTSEWTHIAHKDMKTHAKSQYWICGYCRGYVKESKISVKRLGYMLNVGDMEMKIINKVSPEICPNCYRVRLERARWELVWEIISYWIYKIMVAPILILMFGAVIVCGLIQDPDELGRTYDLILAKLGTVKDDADQIVADMVDEVDPLLDNFRSQTDVSANQNQKRGNNKQLEKQQKKLTKHASDPKYVSYHYSDTQLIASMNEMDRDETIFDVAVRDDIWELLRDAKNDIDAFLLREKINRHIISLSSENELTQFEFFDDYINMNGLRKNGGDFLWNEYFKPLSQTIFERIQELRNDYVPLNLFKRYPFDMPLVIDDFQQFFDQKDNLNLKSLNDLNIQQIVDAMSECQPLNCGNDDERKQILKSINNDRDDVWQLSQSDKIFDKWVRYMSEVQALFQDTRTIKNMLRDVSTGIIERGADSSVFRDQIHFLFEDIRNVTLATPFFNSMRTELVRGEFKVELWTIRNTLYSLYFLSSTVRAGLLQQHARIYVTLQELLDRVYHIYSNDIIDPEGVTNLIFTGSNDDDDDSDADNQMDMKQMMPDLSTGSAYGHAATKTLDFAQKSTIVFDNDDDDDDDNQMNEEERHQIVADRMELFHQNAITASAVSTEITSIFNKIQDRRSEKITESTIDYYRRNGLKNVRLLQDDESLRFIFEQLSRYATFYPQKMKTKCSIDILKEIFWNTLEFNSDYYIDTEAIPRIIMSEKYIIQLYNHLLNLYNDTIADKFNSIIIEQTLEYMTLEDILSIIMLYERTFSVLRTKAVSSGDNFVATHDVFCKFVDPRGFNVDKSKQEWTNKTQSASDLFQSVLDEQQNFITLGQIRQTIDKLINDIASIKCGELTRIMNHLLQEFKNDNKRCKNDRILYVKFQEIKRTNTLNNGGTNDDNDANELQTQLSIRDDDDPASNDNKQMKNPGLAFKHLSKNKFNSWVDNLSAGFKMNIRSTKISNLLGNKKGFHADDDDDNKYDPQDDDQKGKKIIDSILDNTTFDIINSNNNDDQKDDQKDPKPSSSSLKKKRGTVFDTALSFCSKRITLQQLFQFSKRFRTFLRKINKINKILSSYNKIIRSSSTSADHSINQKMENYMKKHRIPKRLKYFKKEYFSKDVSDIDNKIFTDEIAWLYFGCENQYDLCHKIYPFWSGSIISDIYNFMESTEQIQGNYELKEAEFGQLKHSLNVNDELATKLFHIIRFKIRTLSWQQIYNYFKFILKLKYNIQRAILKSIQAEDTTVAVDGIKILLKIQLNDESDWLFKKVISLHGAKVTWKQIRKYLKKMVLVRDEMRDFFDDNARDREFNDKQPELINNINNNIDNNYEKNEQKQDIILKKLKKLTKNIKKLQKSLQNINSRQKSDFIVAPPPNKINNLTVDNKNDYDKIMPKIGDINLKSNYKSTPL